MTPTAPLRASLPARGLIGHLLACVVGAGVDNIFKLGVATALTASAINETESQSLSQWVTLLFTVPFLLVAPTAGTLGDRLPKHLIIRAARVADVAVCAMGVAGIWLHSVPLMLITVGLLATISAFFAPVKLAVVPELVGDADLPTANAKLAGLTVLAILAGMGLAALAAHPERLAVVTAILCIAGLVGAWMIPPLKAKNPTVKIAMPWSLVRQVRALGQTGENPTAANKSLWIPALSLAGFWALATVAATQIVPLVTSNYHHVTFSWWLIGEFSLDGTDVISGTAMALGLGLVAGSVLAVRLLSRAFPAGLPIFGALLAGLCLAGAGWHVHHGGGALGFAAWLFGAGVGAGWWEVPVTLMLQERAAPERRNLVMSGATILGTLASIILIVALMPLTLGSWSQAWKSADIFILVGLGTVVLASICWWIYRLQVVAWMMGTLTRTVWSLDLTGEENLPDHGGCLIIANHLSYADGFALCSKLKRPVRFLVFSSFFKVPVLGFVLRAIGAIPVGSGDRRTALVASLDTAVAALQRGEVVAIFPEGKLTRSGTTDRFKGGLERIASRAGVPVIPVYLDGLYGTWMSRSPVKQWLRPLRRVSVRVGAPLPSSVTAGEARRAVMALGHEQASARAHADQRTLATAALGLMRQHPRAICVRDAQGTLLNWQALGVARALIPLLNLSADDRRIGLLLPPGRAGVLVNLALAIAGRTAVNLNHTAGAPAVATMCSLAEIRTVITATPYLKRITDPTLDLVLNGQRLIRAEELIPRVGRLTVVWKAVQCLALPARWLCQGEAGDVAAIVFSSGSTGDPKGVQLTHREILANCRAVRQGLDLQAYRDVILSPLPLFHSFGLIPGMWLGLTHGLSLAAHPDPTDGATIGKLAKELGATFLISTPTFVRGWMRRIEPEQFKTLRLAVVGAERCPAELKTAFKERYGLDLLEGYGCTELAPTVSVNLPEVRRDGEVEVHSKVGAVGRPLPGMTAFTVNPETLAILPPDAEGLIVIRSPSRMLGYLKREDLTAKAFIHDGYNTGDMGRVDDDGFIHITGRLARFAKIAGEMVPLDNVEALLQAGLAELSETLELAVAAVPDEARGERLVVLHTGYDGDWALILSRLDGQPALWKPKAKDIRAVATIPKLGTGKRDLAGLKALANSDVAAVAAVNSPEAST